MDKQHLVEVFDTFVRRYILFWFYGLIPIELAALWLKSKGIPVHLVSQTAREIAFKGLPTLAYFMAGLAVHFFVTWRFFPWDGIWTTIFGLLFWGVGVTYLMADIFDPNYLYWPIVTQWLRYPPVVATIGMVLALICFPQKSVWFPGKF